MYDLIVRSSASEGVVKIGESVVFFPFVLIDYRRIFSGEISWKLILNAVDIVASGTLPLRDWGAGVMCRSNSPAYYRCEFSFVDQEGNKHKKSVGVLFGHDKIVASLPVPNDFDEFWRVQLQDIALDKYPLQIESSPLGESPQIHVYDICEKSVPEIVVRGVAAFPAERKSNAKFPAIIFFDGAGVRGAGIEGFECWAARGFMAFHFNAHGIENNRDPEYYQSVAGNFGNYMLKGWLSGNPRDIYMRNVFLRVKRAVDIVCSRQDWDGENLVLIGGSQGAWQVFAGAYLDSRVSAVATWIPAGSDLFNGGWPFFNVMPCKSQEKAQYEKILPYFDNTSFVSKLGIPVMMAIGLADSTCKADGIIAAYNNCPSLRKQIQIYSQMEHETTIDVQTELDRFICDVCISQLH